VEPALRNGPVPAQLLQFATQHCIDRGDDLGVISGAVRRLKLYQALGFEAFGPVVGTAEAPYQPMFLTLEKFLRTCATRPSLRRSAAEEAAAERETVNLLPGPVGISPRVLAAFARPPLSHRAPEFVALLATVRRRLAALTRAADVQVLPGSGSLANDIVAGQLAGLRGRGIVISTGEFGERLAEHARRAKLEFHWMRLPWGTPIGSDTLADAMAKAEGCRWLWMVHHETSTSVMNDLSLVKAFARQHGLALCLDCVSSVGAVPVDLSEVHLATAASGKGLASLPGLALMFHQEAPTPRQDLPRYLDLGLIAASESVPFTHSSNLVAALDVALAEVERLPGGRCGSDEDAAWLRGELRAAGFALVADEAHASPIIVTVQLPSKSNVLRVGAALERRGFLTSYRSGYLARRNWIQFCLMSRPSRAALERLVVELREIATPPAPYATVIALPASQPVVHAD
ncbi:MAG: aminotransferase class V-fold PLP-dependent enzyme, partial [Opitutaceae bacterium]